ncbi:hypothetical protein, partial [Gordonia sp. NPDC003585]|uniref:hypothetical protein n=1 Tax=Gordonia sp. NPDC003585 TaxID=3154275 RepID=UPI0033AFED7E
MTAALTWVDAEEPAVVVPPKIGEEVSSARFVVFRENLRGEDTKGRGREFFPYFLWARVPGIEFGGTRR